MIQQSNIIYLCLLRHSRQSMTYKTYNKLGGLKKRPRSTMHARINAVKQVSSYQNQTMVALVKLKSYGITDEDILTLNNYF